MGTAQTLDEVGNKRERDRRTKARIGKEKERRGGVTNGMGRYEGEVIQLLSNLEATLLGGETVGGKREKLSPAGSVFPYPRPIPHPPARIEPR